MAGASIGPLMTGKHALAAGFRGEGLVTSIAVAGAESGYNPVARHDNSRDHPPGKGIDRGLWQINSYWHPEVSDAMADNPATAAQAAFRISAAGTSFGAWSAYNNGQFRAHLAEARAAAQSLAVDPNPAGDAGAVIGLPIPAPGGNPLDIIKWIDPTLELANPFDVAKAALALAAKAGQWVAQRHNWIRVIEVLGGVVGLVVALNIITTDTLRDSPAAVTAVKAAAAA